MSQYYTCCTEQRSIKKQNRLFLWHQSNQEILEKEEEKDRRKSDGT